MDNDKIALVLPFFGRLNDKKGEAFLAKLDQSVQNGTLVFLGNTKKDSYKGTFKNINIIKFSHSNEFGNAFRSGLSAAVELGGTKIVTFEAYTVNDATWFLPYLTLSNVMESGKRSFMEMFTTEIANILSFHNVYNAFSMNRIYTKEAVEVIKESKLKTRAFLSESVSLLNAHDIKTTEVISKDKKKTQPIKMQNKEILTSIAKSTNKKSITYVTISFLAYIVNLLIVYFSISIGAFYPAAILVGGEIGLVSNFIMNERLVFKQSNLFNSIRRFGKFTIFGFIPLVIDIVLITLLFSYGGIFNKTALKIISIAVIVIVSGFSIFMMNKLIWNQENNVKVNA